MDKIFKVNKKLSYCIIILTVVGLISGMMFTFVLKESDYQKVSESLNMFIDSVINNELNYGLSLKSNLITNIIYVFIIWGLGISFIGLPIILSLYFIKVFSIGFTISAITLNYGLRGLVYSFIYIFPHNILNVFIFGFLTLYSVIYSFRISSSFFKKESIDFRPILNKHKYVLLVALLGVIITSLYSTYIMPYILKGVLKFLK